MDNVTPEKKQPIIKTLAVAGLVAIIIFSAWLAIQIVQVLPAALSSLASLADSVYNYNPNQTQELELSTSQTMVNINEPVTLSWPALQIPGTYTFTYTCQEGISLDLKAGEKDFTNLTCNVPYELGTVDTISLSINSTLVRFADVEYTVSFFRTDATTATASHTGLLTIVNSSITTKPSSIVPPTEELPVTPPTQPTPPVVETATTTAPAPVVPTTKPPVTKPSVTVKPATPIYLYEIPKSQPNGKVDLAVSYIGIGTQSANGLFNDTGVLRKNSAGAMQFSVHNIGTKTSERWSFTAKLPGDISYTSSNLEPLRPNERAVLTVAFPAGDTKDLETFSVAVKTEIDTNSKNNSFTWSTVVLR